MVENAVCLKLIGCIHLCEYIYIYIYVYTNAVFILLSIFMYTAHACMPFVPTYTHTHIFTYNIYIYATIYIYTHVQLSKLSKLMGCVYIYILYVVPLRHSFKELQVPGEMGEYFHFTQRGSQRIG